MDLQLILMGLLMREPAHGYELRQMLEKELSPLFHVSPASLYYTLKKNEKEGLVSDRSTVSGKRPKKYGYSLTPSGRTKIKNPLLQNISDLQRPFFNLDKSLYFLNYLESQGVEKPSKDRQKEQRKLIFLLDRQKNELVKEPIKSREYITTVQNLRFAQAELDFVKDLFDTFSQEILDKTAVYDEVK